MMLLVVSTNNLPTCPAAGRFEKVLLLMDGDPN
jgi:hypothetical protein